MRSVPLLVTQLIKGGKRGGSNERKQQRVKNVPAAGSLTKRNQAKIEIS